MPDDADAVQQRRGVECGTMSWRTYLRILAIAKLLKFSVTSIMNRNSSTALGQDIPDENIPELVDSYS